MEQFTERKIGPKMRRRIHDLILHEGITPVTLSDGLINDLIDCGSIISLRTGQSLVAQGEVNPDFYILIEGIMRQWYVIDNTEVTVAFGIAGTQILNYAGFTANKPSESHFEAYAKSKLMRVPREDYDRMLRTSLEFCNWRLRLAYDQFYFTEMHSKVMRGDARQRYATLLECRPEIVQKVSLKVIATYLGVSPQYLSHIRNSL